MKIDVYDALAKKKQEYETTATSPTTWIQLTVIGEWKACTSLLIPDILKKINENLDLICVWGVGLHRSNTGIMDSNPTWDMNVFILICPAVRQPNLSKKPYQISEWIYTIPELILNRIRSWPDP